MIETVRPLVLGVLSAATVFVTLTTTSQHHSAYLRVTFLNIGQGDAILIETPDGIQTLVDGGRDSMVLRELGATLGGFDRDLDLVVGTHPDLDHIGGLIDVFDRYEVKSVMTTENQGETEAAATYRAALEGETVNILWARAGQVYQLGASTTMTILSPSRNPALLESNTASIVMKITYGEIDFMLTGDAPASIENYLTTTYGPTVLASEVLKLGHHGSKTSSSEFFLQAVQPQYAVVSAGRDNDYGHPHVEVIDRVQDLGIIIKSTANDGRVTFASDGKTVWVE